MSHHGFLLAVANFAPPEPEITTIFAPPEPEITRNHWIVTRHGEDMNPVLTCVAMHPAYKLFEIAMFWPNNYGITKNVI